MGCQPSKASREYDVDTYLKKAKTGDVVLFSSEDGHDSNLIKAGTFSPYTHVGMAVVFQTRSGKRKVYLWHSPTSPLRHLPDMLSDPPKSKDGPQMNKMEIALKSFVQTSVIRVRRMQHEIGSRHPWANGVVDKDDPLVGFMLDEHVKHYERNRLELMLSGYDGVFGENKENLSSYFCSELVAETFKRFGVLRTDLPSNEFTPADFAEGYDRDLRLGSHVRLTREIAIVA